MSVSANLNKIKSSLPDNVKLVAVSKYHTIETIMEAYDAGQRAFGENRVQELCEKQKLMPKDIEWHMIGHLQTNKVKQIVPFISLVQSVDSFKLLKEINKESIKVNRTTPCLLQFHIAEEEAKFGFNEEECIDMLKSSEFNMLNNISIAGVMGMATFTNNKNQVKKEFGHLKSIFDNIKNTFFKIDSCFKEISMGMSGDYSLAIEKGSNIVRVGTAIFGARQY